MTRVFQRRHPEMADREVFAEHIPITLGEWEALKNNRRPFYFKGWVLLRPPVFEFCSVAWVWARHVG